MIKILGFIIFCLGCIIACMGIAYGLYLIHPVLCIIYIGIGLGALGHEIMELPS